MPPVYRERLSLPWWAWLLALTFTMSVAIAFAGPYGVAVGALSGVIAAVVCAALAVASTAVVEVRDAELFAGAAHLELRFIAQVTVLAADAARQQRGVGADARAWMLLRGWIATAVRIDLDDPADPTPYWYVSTRTPQALADVIDRERAAHRTA